MDSTSSCPLLVSSYFTLGGTVIGGMVDLNIFLLAFVSGASMNPARSLAPAILSGYLDDLWLYWTTLFIDSGIVAGIYRKKFVK